MTSTVFLPYSNLELERKQIITLLCEGQYPSCPCCYFLSVSLSILLIRRHFWLCFLKQQVEHVDFLKQVSFLFWETTKTENGQHHSLLRITQSCFVSENLLKPALEVNPKWSGGDPGAFPLWDASLRSHTFPVELHSSDSWCWHSVFPLSGAEGDRAKHKTKFPKLTADDLC